MGRSVYHRWLALRIFRAGEGGEGQNWIEGWHIAGQPDLGGVEMMAPSAAVSYAPF